MTVYFILLAGSFAVGIPLCRDWGLPEKKAKFLRITYCFIVGFAFFLLSAIRKSTGYDYNLYAQWYNQMYFMSYEKLVVWSREKGFTVPVKIFQVVSEHYQIMFVIISFVIAASVMVYIYKYSPLPYLSVFAFLSFGFYFASMNFMRQLIAAIIVSFALKYIQLNMPVRYLVYVLLASCFHFSALLMIPFYFILKIRLNLIVLGIYSAVSAVLFVKSEVLLKKVTEYFYSGYDPLSSVHMTGGFTPVFTIVCVVFFIIIFLFRKQLTGKREYNSILINCWFFVVFFELIGIKHAVVARFLLYFAMAPLIILVPDLIEVIKEALKNIFGKNRRIFAVLTCSLYIVLITSGVWFYYFYLEKDYSGVVPYQTIWGI